MRSVSKRTGTSNSNPAVTARPLAGTRPGAKHDLAGRVVEASQSSGVVLSTPSDRDPQRAGHRLRDQPPVGVVTARRSVLTSAKRAVAPSPVPSAWSVTRYRRIRPAGLHVERIAKPEPVQRSRAAPRRRRSRRAGRRASARRARRRSDGATAQSARCASRGPSQRDDFVAPFRPAGRTEGDRGRKAHIVETGQFRHGFS